MTAPARQRGRHRDGDGTRKTQRRRVAALLVDLCVNAQNGRRYDRIDKVMANGPSHPISASHAEPLSALAIAAAAEPPPPYIPSVPQLLLQRLRPLAVYAGLFVMGLSGGLAVATTAGLVLHYLNGSREQVAAARVAIAPQAPEPLDLEIRKAKADLDAALRNGS